MVGKGYIIISALDMLSVMCLFAMQVEVLERSWVYRSEVQRSLGYRPAKCLPLKPLTCQLQLKSKTKKSK